jgi:AcrR family transcriptional regulator
VRWAGVAPNDRVAERRALLLDAALELVGTRGLAGTTVRGVCAEARLNPRYFYESFADLEELAVAVFDRTMDDLRTAGDAAGAAAGPDPVARVRALVAGTVGFVDDDRRRGRVLYVEGRTNERLQRRRWESGSMIATLVAAEAAGPDDVDQVHQVVGAFLVGGLSDVLMRWSNGAIPIGRDELVDDLTVLCVYLGRAGHRITAERGGAGSTGS